MHVQDHPLEGVGGSIMLGKSRKRVLKRQRAGQRERENKNKQATGQLAYMKSLIHHRDKLPLTLAVLSAGFSSEVLRLRCSLYPNERHRQALQTYLHRQPGKSFTDRLVYMFANTFLFSIPIHQTHRHRVSSDSPEPAFRLCLSLMICG